MADTERDGLDELVEQFARQYREPVVGFGEQVRTEQGQETWNGLVAQYETETGQQLPDDARGGAPRTAEPGQAPVTEVPGGFRMPLDLAPDEPDGARSEADFEAG